MFEKRKLKKQIKMLTKQVENGDLQAMYDLAMIYLDGTIIKKDYEKAMSLLKFAADQGHIQSKTYLMSSKLVNSATIGAKALSDIIDIFKK